MKLCSPEKELEHASCGWSGENASPLDNIPVQADAVSSRSSVWTELCPWLLFKAESLWWFCSLQEQSLYFPHVPSCNLSLYRLNSMSVKDIQQGGREHVRRLSMLLWSICVVATSPEDCLLCSAFQLEERSLSTSVPVLTCFTPWLKPFSRSSGTGLQQPSFSFYLSIDLHHLIL